MKRTSIAILVALTGTLAAQPDPKRNSDAVPKPPGSPTPAAPPTPAKELDVLKRYFRAWTCTPNIASPPASNAAIKLTFKRELS